MRIKEEERREYETEEEEEDAKVVPKDATMAAIFGCVSLHLFIVNRQSIDSLKDSKPKG